jgi:hypothetical protein
MVESQPVNANPNNKPEGWLIPSSGKVLSRKTVELNSPNGTEKVVAVVRDVPPDSRIEIPYYSGRANFQARVRSVTELSKEGQQPYAYQVIVSEWCEFPANCVPVAWQIVLRDEDGDRIFETYGDNLLPPAWAD